MRYLWPSLTLVLLAVVAFLYTHDRVSGCEALEDGGTLHLTRSGFATVRARFCYAADCRLIAAQMSKVELAKWSCD